MPRLGPLKIEDPDFRLALKFNSVVDLITTEFTLDLDYLEGMDQDDFTLLIDFIAVFVQKKVAMTPLRRFVCWSMCNL
jgi:hypothetical protein